MKPLLLITSSIFMAVCANVSWASCTKWDVIEADHRWKDAIDLNNAHDVVSLYADDGILIPTFGVIIIDNQIDRLQYFKKLFKEIDHLSVHFEPGTRHIQFLEGGAVSSGFYTFKGMVDEGDVETPARYNFIYEQIHYENEPHGCHLQLIQHHSSEQPFGNKIAQLIAE